MSTTSAPEIDRAHVIGASQIAMITGDSPFGDGSDVFLENYGLSKREQTEAMFWGKKHEPTIARVFSERMAIDIDWWDRPLFSKKRPWQRASPDAFLLDDAGQRTGVLECKTADLHHAGEWDRDCGDEDGIPDYYLAQVEWQMSVTELYSAYVAVLIAGNDFRIYKIHHDPVLEEILLEEAERFRREHLIPGIPPPISGSKRASEYLKRRYPRECERLRPATIAEIAQLSEYAQLRAQLGALQTRRDELENQLKQAIGDAEGLSWPGGKMTWRKTKDRMETNWEELAKAQLVGYSDEEKAAFIEQYTHVSHGVRRIHFGEAA